MTSRTELPGGISTQDADRTFTFLPDKNGLLSTIQIEAPITRPAMFHSEVVNTPEEAIKSTVIHRTDDVLLQSLRTDFQLLESLLALQGVSNVRWSAMRYELIFETEQEERAAVISSWRSERGIPEQIVTFNTAALEELVRYKERFRSLATPLSFYREGMNDYASSRFINAFFNFYFIFEGFYGSGKTKNYAIEEEMKKSVDFVKAITESLRDMKAIAADAYVSLCNEMQASDPPTAETVIEHLVLTRGRLHHFTNNPRRIEGTPFTHERFEPVAELSRQLALGVLFIEISNINERASEA